MTTNEALFEYCLRLGDTSLVLGQRLAEWCGHGPVLEEDIALTNISLDLIGQTRAFYTYACQVEGKGRTEDDLAYFRDERDFRNLLIVEQPNGDFGQTIMRQLMVSCFYYHYYSSLKKSKDETLSPLAEKSLKEVAYHLRHSADWTIRLGQGTEESARRMRNAIDELWIFVEDMFDMDKTDELLIKAGIGVDTAPVRAEWETQMKQILTEAGLNIPEKPYAVRGSRQGKHSEHLGHLLAEMQAVQRSIPGAQW